MRVVLSFPRRPAVARRYPGSPHTGPPPSAAARSTAGAADSGSRRPSGSLVTVGRPHEDDERPFRAGFRLRHLPRDQRDAASTSPPTPTCLAHTDDRRSCARARARDRRPVHTLLAGWPSVPNLDPHLLLPDGLPDVERRREPALVDTGDRGRDGRPPLARAPDSPGDPPLPPMAL